MDGERRQAGTAGAPGFGVNPVGAGTAKGMFPAYAVKHNGYAVRAVLRTNAEEVL
jgi:hypothetical protein